MGMIAINAIYEKGLSVPDDISVIGISDIEFAKYTNPLDYCCSAHERNGVAAAETLCTDLKEKSNSQERYITYKISYTESTRKIN